MLLRSGDIHYCYELSKADADRENGGCSFHYHRTENNQYFRLCEEGDDTQCKRGARVAELGSARYGAPAPATNPGSDSIIEGVDDSILFAGVVVVLSLLLYYRCCCIIVVVVLSLITHTLFVTHMT